MCSLIQKAKPSRLKALSKSGYIRVQIYILEMELFPGQTMRIPDGLTKSMTKMKVSVVQDLKTL